MDPMSAEKARGKSAPAPAGEAAHSFIMMRKRWLAALAALIILPWLVVAAIYFQESAESASARPAQPANAAASVSSAVGDWGTLSITPIVISPPLEYIPSDWSRITTTDQWFFPGAPVEVVETFLLSAGLSPVQISRLRTTARPDPRTKGMVVTPDLDLVRNLPQQVRAKLYNELGKTELNFDQANAFRFYGSTTEDWLGGSMISSQTRQIVEPLIYRDGDVLLFADPEVARSLISDPVELRRLAKTLLRQSTMVVRLTITDSNEIPALAEYWGRGGRRTDLRPLLESAFESMPDRSVDIVHLLPTFARNHLYRYPRLTAADLNKPVLANCLWSALNFFNNQPDDRYLDINTALKTLQRDYYIVEDGFQLGDVVAFVDKNGNLFHVATHLAGDIVLSKNGTSPVAPWAITTIGHLKAFYRLRSAEPRLMYHRRNDM